MGKVGIVEIFQSLHRTIQLSSYSEEVMAGTIRPRNRRHLQIPACLWHTS